MGLDGVPFNYKNFREKNEGEILMGEYKDQKSGVSVSTGEKFAFPTSGAKILLKARPPIAKEVNTD
ncbi:MAG: hypothetical protein ABH842_04845 [Candidatus Micrarchaeota archaeon]